jgi:hypothetical protein
VIVEMERTMAINIPRAAQWARDVANQVRVSDAKVRELNGASGLATDMHGEPAQGLRAGYGRGGAPAAAQVGTALGTMVYNFQGLRRVGREMEKQVTEPDEQRAVTGHGPDKYFHCKANCEAAKAGPYGAAAGWALSDGLKEGFDGVVDPIARPFVKEEDRSKYVGVDPRDLAANAQGRRAGQTGGQCHDSCRALTGGADVPKAYR